MNRNTLIIALTLAISPKLWAQSEAQLVSNELELSGMNGQQQYQLKLQLPDKQLKTLILPAAEALSFSSNDFGINQFVDGQYKYELTPIAATQERTGPSNQSADNPHPSKLNGAFMVSNGQSYTDQDEGDSDENSTENVNRAAPITGNVSIRDSLCVGLDCDDSENYGFDTIRLKENNMRIKFDDTSAGASFPANDWEITANSSDNGGLNFLGFTDVTAGNQPFTVEAGAGADALYVDSLGQVGLGTSTPVVELHVIDGDTPTLRLDQGPDNGWVPQIWDLAGNETNFFVRDVTNGSLIPFKIAPGSPNDSVFIKDDGIEFLSNNVVIDDDFRLGLNTDNPKNNIHIKEVTGNAGIILENLSVDTSWKFTNKGSFFEVSKSGTGSPEFAVFDDGRFIVGAGGETPNLDMDASGNVTIQGVLSQNSDVNVKDNIQSVDTAKILDKVMGLPISVWNYKFDDASIKHLGPMAQDFYKLFNLGATDNKIATIDTSGVALASIKELGKKLSEKDQEIENLKVQNNQLEERLNALEKTIMALQ